MLICIGPVLSTEQLQTLRQQLLAGAFVEGQATAGWSARLVKNNLQLDAASPEYAQLQKTVAQALFANEVFSLAAMPKAARPLLFSRYQTGMGYGDHVDNALMGEAPRIRSDVSFTLFLSEPDEYDGGELVIDELSGSRSFKLPAGSVVLYPSNALHRVDTVTRGERLVAVGWIQSLVRDPAQRQLIFELETLRREMFQKEGKTPAFDTLSKSVSNLWRMWAEP